MMYNSFADLINAWPRVTALARDTGINLNALYQMRNRDFVHPRYWEVIITASHKRGINGVSYESLGKLASRTDSDKQAA